MRSILIGLLWALALVLPIPAQAKIAAGTLDDLGILQSRYDDPRRVMVWLPSSYRPGGPKHAVIYMHDGQNLFDKADAGYGMEWEVDEHREREAWRSLFNHYVFRDQGDPAEHLPEAARGILGPQSAEQIAQLKANLAEALRTRS